MKLDGLLEKNSLLDYSEKIYDGHINAPESIDSRKDGEIFVSSHEGNILRIWGKHWENSEIVSTIGPTCQGIYRNV